MGRPRRFDEPQLLDAAQERFWTRGYDRTSIEDVAAASGVGNGSIYAAYTNKLGLFLAVFERYCAGRVALVQQVVAGHTGPFEEAVGHYLDAIVAECTGWQDRRGCLMLNSVAELASRFPEVVSVGRRTMTAMEDVLSDRVAVAVADHELDLAPEQVRPLGAHILLVSQGLIQLSRIGMPDTHLQSVAALSSRLSALRAAA
jgi:TetR/AcrR family transcriptional repressor of nem operon